MQPQVVKLLARESYRSRSPEVTSSGVQPAEAIFERICESPASAAAARKVRCLVSWGTEDKECEE